MVEHWAKLVRMLGQPIVPLNTLSFRKMCEQEGALPNFRMRFCTRRLKVEPWLAFLQAIKPCVSYVGLRADEPEDAREGIILRGGDLSVLAAERIVEQRYPLREAGWTIGDVWRCCEDHDAVPPERTDCARCFYQRLPEWWRLWRYHSKIFADAEQQEHLTGHTFRSPGRDSWPAALSDLRKEFERGRVPRNAREMDLFAIAQPCAGCVRYEFLSHSCCSAALFGA